MQFNLVKFKAFPLISIIICLLCFCLYSFKVFHSIDNIIYDYFTVCKQDNNTYSDITIIGIGPESLEKIPDWPWKRSKYAKLLANLYSSIPAAIGFDLIFDSSRPGDKELIDSLKHFQNITLGFAKDGNDLLFPDKEFIKYTIPSDVNILQDSDGIVRRFKINSLYHNKYKTFAASIINMVDSSLLANINNNEDLLINFSIPTKNFKHYEFCDLYQNPDKLKQLKGKIVLIGLTAESLAQNKNIPLSNKTERSISGVELQAHIIQSILNKSFITLLKPLWLLFLLLLTGISLEVLIKTRNPLKQVIITLLFLSIFLIISYISLSYLNKYIPPTVFLVSIAVINFTFMAKSLFKINRTVKQTIYELSTDNYIPLKKISDQIDKEVITLSELSQVISKDRQLIKAILDAINSPVFVVDKDSKIIWKNKLSQQLKNIDSIETLYFLNIDFEEFKSEIKENTIYRKEISLENKDFTFIATPSGDTNNPYVCILNDITELKNLDRLKTDLLRTVSHEIRTPLTVIQSYCDLGIDMEDGEIALQYLDKISAKTEELTNLVTDFLDLNKLEANMIDLKLTNFDLKPFIESIINDYIELAGKKDQTIEFNCVTTDIITIQADKTRLKQVIINLLSNAIKYSPEHTTINITIDRKNNYSIISIADQGFGMTEEETLKIFDKFYRIQNQHTEQINGTGLGLAIARKIIDMHKGSIDVNSKVGSGTIFRVSLPLK